MKKIISYSLWGSNPLYIDGAVRNAEERERFYPDWICRFYHDDTVLPSVLDRLKDLGCELKRMKQTYDVLGMFWRFHVMFDDPDVERFIVRDTDSGFSDREVMAVNQWVESGKPLHIIRDCESHGTHILGGTWGAIPGCIPFFEKRMLNFIHKAQPDFKNPRGVFHGYDQFFLTQCVWPILYNNHMAHVRAGCPKIKYTPNDIELPEWHEGERYVGMVC